MSSKRELGFGKWTRRDQWGLFALIAASIIMNIYERYSWARTIALDPTSPSSVYRLDQDKMSWELTAGLILIAFALEIYLAVDRRRSLASRQDGVKR